MVMLKPQTEKDYPHFALFLQRHLVHVVENRRIMDAWVKWSVFRDVPSQLKHLYTRYFNYGEPPFVDPLPPGKSDCVYADTGRKNPTGSDGSNHRELIGLEYGMTWDKSAININPKLMLAVGRVVERMLTNAPRQADDTLIFRGTHCTIMHEMIHWSYYLKDIKEEQQPGYNGDEEYGTRQFEREAYGAEVHIPISRFCVEHLDYRPFAGVVVENTAVTKAGAGDVTARVAAVQSGSPADKAGLRVGDIVLTWDGKKVWNEEFFDRFRASSNPGDHVSLEISRGGATLVVRLTLGAKAPPSENPYAKQR